MSILNLIKEDESLKYISLKEAINLLATKTNSNIYEVATYLLNKNVASHLDSYARQKNYRIEATSSSMNELHWYGENYCFVWLEYIAEDQKHYPSFSIGGNTKYNKGCEENFWKRIDFFNLECIQSLSLFNNGEFSSNKQQQYIWDKNYLALLQLDPPLDTDEDHFIDDFLFSYEGNYPTAPCFDESIQQTKTYPLYFKNKTFSIHEATCLMTRYDPIETRWDYENINWLIDNPEYEKASNFIFSAVRTNLFEEFSNGEYFITSDNLKILLNESNRFIDGFNNKESIVSNNENLIENTKLKNTIANLELDVAIEQVAVKELNSEIEKIKQENKGLKTELSEKGIEIQQFKKTIEMEKKVSFESWLDQDKAEKVANELQERIKQLESEKQIEAPYIDNTHNDLTPELEIPNARQRNNVLRIISILSDMADLPPDEHFVAFNMMEAHANKKCKEIPKKDTVANWLKESKKF